MQFTVRSAFQRLAQSIFLWEIKHFVEKLLHIKLPQAVFTFWQICVFVGSQMSCVLILYVQTVRRRCIHYHGFLYAVYVRLYMYLCIGWLQVSFMFACMYVCMYARNAICMNNIWWQFPWPRIITPEWAEANKTKISLRFYFLPPLPLPPTAAGCFCWWWWQSRITEQSFPPRRLNRED